MISEFDSREVAQPSSSSESPATDTLAVVLTLNGGDGNDTQCLSMCSQRDTLST